MSFIGGLLGRMSQSCRDYLLILLWARRWCRTAERAQDFVRVLRVVGTERVLFGSDWPLAHPAESLKAIRSLPLTTEEYERIRWRNAESLWERCRSVQVPVHRHTTRQLPSKQESSCIAPDSVDAPAPLKTVV